FFCSLLAPSDAILFQEGVSVKPRLPQLINDALTICEIVFRPGVRFVYVVTGKSSSQGFLVS
ncbi:hypothetical protein QU862_24330, partial [Escherichia coli]|nr:hypothetical protein [Escherichia coli]